MNILIGTPCYNGAIYDGYLRSMIKTITSAIAENIVVTVYTINNSPLINVARNKIANFMYSSGDAYDKLLFIDADITWEWQDIKRLLASMKPVIAGAYPYKGYPIGLPFNPLPELIPMFPLPRKMADFYKFKEKYADPVTGEVEVMHMPTGFMMIDKEVFKLLAPKCQRYQSHDMTKDHNAMYFDFFPIGKIRDEMLESEDWGFCMLCRDNGIKVHLNTNVHLMHTGPHTFFVENTQWREQYELAFRTPSDINQLLPVLYDYAKKCHHVTEMGVRTGVSTRAFLYAEPERLVSYDLYIDQEVAKLFERAKFEGKSYSYVQADVLQVIIEPTDLLFIDTFHCYEQLKKELELHASKVRKYIVFHDVETHGYKSEVFHGLIGSNGIRPAIDEFLAKHPEWQVKVHIKESNGLMVLEKVA